MGGIHLRDTLAPMSDAASMYEPILGLRKGGAAVVLLTYRGDW